MEFRLGVIRDRDVASLWVPSAHALLDVQNKTFEVDQKALEGIVDAVREDEPFSYRGREFILFYDPTNSGKPAEWCASTAFDGGDLYLWENLPAKFKPVIIYHLLVQADLVLHQGYEKEEAYRKASVLERVFAQKRFSVEDYQNYIALRDRLVEKHGGF